jgi:hypothetical protein
LKKVKFVESESLTLVFILIIFDLNHPEHLLFQ